MILDTPTRENILHAIRDYFSHCTDIVTTSYAVTPRVINGRILICPVASANNIPNISLSQSAESQLLSRLTIPVMFFHRCSPSLQHDILTEFNLKEEKDYLFRCIVGGQEGAPEYTARAVVSSIFTTNYDDHLIFPTILEAIPDDLILSLFYKFDDITRLEIQFARPVIYDNHIAQPGVMVTNGETGRSSLWIEPVVLVDNRYRLASRHHIRQEWDGYRFVHRGEGVEGQKILDAIIHAQTAAQVGAIEYLRLSTEEVVVKKAIEFVESIDALPKRYADMMETEWENQQRLSKVTVMKKILDAAAELPIVNQILIEQAVGRWSNIFEDYNSRITSIEEDMRWLQEQNRVTT